MDSLQGWPSTVGNIDIQRIALGVEPGSLLILVGSTHTFVTSIARSSLSAHSRSLRTNLVRIAAHGRPCGASRLATGASTRRSIFAVRRRLVSARAKSTAGAIQIKLALSPDVLLATRLTPESGA